MVDDYYFAGRTMKTEVKIKLLKNRIKAIEQHIQKYEIEKHECIEMLHHLEQQYLFHRGV